MSRLFNLVIHLLWLSFAHLLEDISIWADYLPDFSRAVYAVTNRYQNCFGFIDTTVRAMCRLSYAQHLGYSGHKRKYGLKYQSIAPLNGLI